MVNEQDKAAAEAVSEWFGTWWSARPNQFIAFMHLAKLAALTVHGDADARQILLEGDLQEMLGLTPEQALMHAENVQSVFLAVVNEHLNPDGDTRYEQAAVDSVEWAMRWEANTYEQ